MKHKHVRIFSTLLLTVPIYSIGQEVIVSAQGTTVGVV